jgi:Cytochrome P460
MTSFKTAASVLGSLLVVAAASGAGAPLRIPEALAGYREWGTLLKEPIMVPYELSVLCRPANPRELKEAKQRHGPHNQYLIDVYANPQAKAVLQDESGKPLALPTGAVIAKEKIRYVKPGQMELDGVAFMVKRDGSQFRESGGWEFLFFPPGNAPKTHAACALCHKGAPGADYVFGVYAQ